MLVQLVVIFDNCGENSDDGGEYGDGGAIMTTWRMMMFVGTIMIARTTVIVVG